RGKRRGVVEHERGMSLQELDIEPAEMLCEARAPCGAQQIAGLEQRAHAARAPAPHEAEMPSMRAAEDLRHYVRLAAGLGRKGKACVAPAHRLPKRARGDGLKPPADKAGATSRR